MNALSYSLYLARRRTEARNFTGEHEILLTSTDQRRGNMFGALLDCDNDALALSTVSPQGSDLNWSYSSISRHFFTVAGALNASWRASATAYASSQPNQQQDGDVENRRNVIVCGSMAFQAIMAVVCYRQRYVGVFVPVNAEDTLLSISVVQRASEAFAVVVDDTAWSSLQPQIQSRWALIRSALDVTVWEPPRATLAALHLPAAASVSSSLMFCTKVFPQCFTLSMRPCLTCLQI